MALKLFLYIYVLVFDAVAYVALLGVCLPVVAGLGVVLVLVLHCYRKKRTIFCTGALDMSTHYHLLPVGDGSSIDY